MEGPDMLSTGTMKITWRWKKWLFTKNRICSEGKKGAIWERLTAQAGTKIVWQTGGLEVFGSPHPSQAIWGIISDICELRICGSVRSPGVFPVLHLLTLIMLLWWKKHRWLDDLVICNSRFCKLNNRTVIHKGKDKLWTWGECDISTLNLINSKPI